MAIVADAGGMDSLRRFLPAVTPRSGFAYLVMQHTDPLHATFFHDVLPSEDSLAVVEAADGMPMCQDRLHIIPPGHAVTIEHNRFRLRPLPAGGRQRRPVDLLFCALAREYKSAAMIILLSGAEARGMRGAHAVRAAGGLVLVQDPAEAGFDALPRAAILAHVADAVLPAAAMPAALLAHADRAPPAADDLLPAVLALLQPETPQQLSLYRPATLRRRIQGRAARLGLGQGEYLVQLLQDARERRRLTQDVLVHVGAFFRDHPALRALARQHLPALLAQHPEGEPLRAWVAGCGTGEEAWSLAILLQEAIRAAGRDIPLQLFASDISAPALAAARTGLYPASITESVSAERLATFFEREAAGWRVRPEVRALVVFAAHDALADPPFAAMDIIACATLMRHLPEASRGALWGRLAPVLRPGGLLLALPGAECEPPMPPLAHRPTGWIEAVAPDEGIWRRASRPPGMAPPAPAARRDALAMQAAATEQAVAAIGLPPAGPPPTEGAAEQERLALHAELALRAAEQRAALESARVARADLRNLVAAAGANVLFLDPWLQLRFHTPAARDAFRLDPSDLGRPLEDVQGLPLDPALAEDAARITREGGRAEREVRTASGAIFLRRLLPYHSEDGAADGLVLGFTDITLRARADQALEEARAQAASALAARARFLALAEQDIRQPLQALQLLHGVLGRCVQDAEAARLLRLQGAALAELSGLMGRLLKGAGQGRTAPGRAAPPAAQGMDALVPEPEAVPVEAFFRRLRALPAALGDRLRLVPSALAIRTDPVQFERLLGGLLDLAFAGTWPVGAEARLLLGCRRRGRMLRIELWGQGRGAGLPAPSRGEDALRELEALRKLEPLRALARLLGHPLRGETRPPARGPWFTLDAPLAARPVPARVAEAPARRSGRILVVEPEAEQRDALVRQLTREGHWVAGAADQAGALARFAPPEAAGPDLLLAGPGVAEEAIPALACALRLRFGLTPAVLVLQPSPSGASGAEPARARPGPAGLDEGPEDGMVRLAHPASAQALSLLTQRMLAPVAEPPSAGEEEAPRLVHLLHADAPLRQDLRRVLERDGHVVEEHASAEAFLAAYRPGPQACLVLDGDLPGMGGADLLVALRALGDPLPAVMLTGFGDVPAAVRALRAGASDFLEKPVRPSALLAVLAQLHARAADRASQAQGRNEAVARIARLTPRQRDIMDRVLAGQPSKNIASDLGISRRTVETHRAAIMRQTGAKSLPALARLALAAKRGPGAPV